METINYAGNRYMAPVELEERFWAKAAWSFDGWATRESPCWLWLAATNVKGYGLFRFAGSAVLAHRLAYELEREEIPEGLGLDHLCHNPACVNPWHLEAVTAGVNTDRRLRHCPSCTCKEIS